MKRLILVVLLLTVLVPTMLNAQAVAPKRWQAGEQVIGRDVDRVSSYTLNWINNNVASIGTFVGHTGAANGVHGAAANGRLFTASETLGIANGGTGATASSAALAALGGIKTDATNLTATSAFRVALNLEPYLVVAYQSGAVTFTGGSTHVASYNTEVSDPSNAFSVSSYTAPVSGLYEISACLPINTTSMVAGDCLYLVGMVNGASTVVLSATPVTANASVNFTLYGRSVVSVSAGDTIQVGFVSVHSGNIVSTGSSQYVCSIRKIW